MQTLITNAKTSMNEMTPLSPYVNKRAKIRREVTSVTVSMATEKPGEFVKILTNVPRERQGANRTVTTQMVHSFVPVFPAFSYRLTTALAFRQNRTSVSELDLSVNMPATILPVSTSAYVRLDLNSQPTMKIAKTLTSVNGEFAHNNVPTRRAPMHVRVSRDTNLTRTEPLVLNVLLHITERGVVECVNAEPGWTGVTP